MPDRAISHDRRRPSRAGKRSSSHSQHRKRSESVDITDRTQREIERHNRLNRERERAWEEEERRNRARFSAHRTGRNTRYRHGNDEEELDDDDDDDAGNNRYSGEPSSYARAKSRRPARRTERSRQRRRTRGDYYGVSGDEYDSENAAFIGNQTDDSESALVSKVSKTPAFKKPPKARRPAPLNPRKHESLRHGKAKESPSPSPIQTSHRMQDREGRQRRGSHGAGDDGVQDIRNRKLREGSRRRPSRSRPQSSASASLTPEAIAIFNAENERTEAEREREEARALRRGSGRRSEHRSRSRGPATARTSSSRRLVSGAFMEEGRSGDLSNLRGGMPPSLADHNVPERSGGRGGGGDGPGEGGGRDIRSSSDGGSEGEGAIYGEKQKSTSCFSRISQWSTKKKLLVSLLIIGILLIIIIPVAVVAGKRSSSSDNKLSNSPGQDDSSYPGDTPYNKDLKNISHDDIPKTARAHTLILSLDEMIGGLSLMGLNSSWNDSAQANEHVPALDKDFDYGKTPIRGVSLGGWLSIEPFITPSLFEPYHNSVVDEWTLMKKLGSKSKDTIEKHYATFVQEDTFREIQDAGFDHVRIPFSYWAVKTYDGDEYLPHVSWRYLLRGIEWARRFGLRILLDLHGIPGSQNGWNHSGRQGTIGWLNGTDGDRNAQRGIDIHDQLSKFFAQGRYKNVIGIYGLANEPFMINLNVSRVINWNDEAIKTIRGNGLKQWITFGDGFLKLTKWKTMMQNVDDKLMLDTHQYTIFNLGQIGMTHEAKLKQVCSDDDGGWIKMLEDSNSHKNGFGPTICGEWSQADTDCAEYVNGVGIGSRWTGTLNGEVNAADGTVLTPQCPTAKDQKRDSPKCTCDPANADPSKYSDDYKTFLRTYAEAQMYVFNQVYGWFYWTWDTEKSTQWSYKKARDAGIMPDKA
ncbi:Mitochondrial translocator assembly and maintenance protein 41, partial [Ascosphaera pollenicola]